MTSTLNRKVTPRQGIEPWSPAWQAGILTTILSRTENHCLLAIFSERIFILLVYLYGGFNMTSRVMTCWCTNEQNRPHWLVNIDNTMRFWCPKWSKKDSVETICNQAKRSLTYFHWFKTVSTHQDLRKMVRYSSNWSSPRKSLVKGERFVREWRKPRVTCICILAWPIECSSSLLAVWYVC